MIEGAARLVVPGNDETLGLEPRAAQTQVFGTGTPNGIRTRAATLRGWCPRPLDDGAMLHDLLTSTLCGLFTRRRAVALVGAQGIEP